MSARCWTAGAREKCKGHDSQPKAPSDQWVKFSPSPGDQISIAVGSRWRLMHQYQQDPNWYEVGHQHGYEVLAIETSGFSVAIKMREWKDPNYPTYKCSLQWWDVMGNRAADGGMNRFVAWT